MYKPAKPAPTITASRDWTLSSPPLVSESSFSSNSSHASYYECEKYQRNRSFQSNRRFAEFLFFTERGICVDSDRSLSSQAGDRCLDLLLCPQGLCRALADDDAGSHRIAGGHTRHD